MKNKKILMYIGIIFLILIIIGMGYLIYINVNYNENEINEYIPEQEISDEQLRETIVNLYFLNKETNELEAERREIDSKYLLENPYKYLVDLLINGPINENLVSVIPKDVVIDNIRIENGIVIIEIQKSDFNQETNKEIIIESIEKTLKELNEVEGIEIINSEKQ